MTEEVWKGAYGFEDYYEISNRGRLRSKDRITPNTLTGGTSTVPGRILKGRVNKAGYRQFTLSVGQKNTTRTAHRLVAIAHIPNPEGLPLVLHGPAGRLDNSVQNLRWGTNSDNMLDKRRDGTDHMLNRTHCPQNHEYTPENTRLDAGSRRCITCSRERSKRAYWKRKLKEAMEDGN